MDVQLNFLLIGKTGHGKSATGNSLLGRREFKTSASTLAEPHKMDIAYSQFGSYTLKLVDGLDLEDTDMRKTEDKTAMVRNVEQALAICNGVIDAFLLIMKFGCRVTAEDRSALDALKLIFGDRFLDHVIVVFTGGDLFQLAADEEEMDITFQEWCSKQTGEFRHLYEDCNRRFVLFNNREKNEKMMCTQKQDLVQLALEVREKYGPYTGKQLSIKERERSSARIHDLKQQLEVHDKGYCVSKDLQETCG